MIEIPVRIQSTPNLREHFHKTAQRAKMHRQTAFWACWSVKSNQPIPSHVRLIRIAPRALDSQTLAAGFEAVRDGIADWLRISANDPRVSWEYEQQQGGPKEFSVRIEFPEAEK